MREARDPNEEETSVTTAGCSSQIDFPLIEASRLEKSHTGISAIRKLNWRVAPLCAAITILAYIDRGNLGFAASKICDELSLTHSEYGLGASLFFVGYVLSQVPSNILLKRLGATRWLAFLLVFWGLTASSLAFVQNTTQFYTLRFFLGFAEGGCFPGVWYYVSTFFPSLYIAFPFALTEASIHLSSPVSAPLAAGLLALDGIYGVDGWRLLFFVEGIVPVIFGLFLPWLLPSSPTKAGFLTNEEKIWIEFELNANHGTSFISISTQLKIVFSKLAFWGLSFFHFLRFILLNTGLYWTTLIIDDMLHGDDDDDEDDDTCASSKSTGVLAVILTTVPFTMCAVFCIYIGHISSTMKNRPVISGLIAGSGSIFWIVWMVSRHNVFTVALLALGFAISCANMIQPLVIGMLSCTFEVHTRATALAAMNTIGSCGGILGPILVGHLVGAYGYGTTASFLSVVALVSGIILLTLTDPINKTASHEHHLVESTSLVT
eukprot:g6043.t1